MDYKKYETDGWGLSQTALVNLNKIIASFNKEKIRIIEFGSGKSTEFLHDLNDELSIHLEVTSFDNDLKYSYKPKDGDNVKLLIRDLIECNDVSYKTMFSNKEYDRKLMESKTTPLHTRQKNNFYDVSLGDIEGLFDIVILDGPNGNGRNFAFLHLKNNLKSGTYVLIDDHTHYDFELKFLSIFDAEIYVGEKDFVIYKII